MPDTDEEIFTMVSADNFSPGVLTSDNFTASSNHLLVGYFWGILGIVIFS